MIDRLFGLEHPLRRGLRQLNELDIRELTRFSQLVSDSSCGIPRSPVYAKLHEACLVLDKYYRQLYKEFMEDPEKLMNTICKSLPDSVIQSYLILEKLDESSKILNMLASRNQAEDFYASAHKAIADVYNAIRMMQMTDPRDCYQWIMMAVNFLKVRPSADIREEKHFLTTQEVMKSLAKHNDLTPAAKAHCLIGAVFSDYQFIRDAFFSAGVVGTLEEYMNKHPDRFHSARKLGLILNMLVQVAEFRELVPEKIRQEIAEYHLSELKNPYKDFMVHVPMPPSNSELRL